MPYIYYKNVKPHVVKTKLNQKLSNIPPQNTPINYILALLLQINYKHKRYIEMEVLKECDKNEGFNVSFQPKSKCTVLSTVGACTPHFGDNH